MNLALELVDLPEFLDVIRPVVLAAAAVLLFVGGFKFFLSRRGAISGLFNPLPEWSH